MKVSAFICFLVYLYLPLQSVTHAEEFVWQTQENIQGIEVATTIDNDGASWVKVSTVVPVHYWSLLNLLRDTQQATDWVDNAKQITLVKRPDFRTDIVHTIIHAPWPFANREMFTISTISFDIHNQSLTIDVEQMVEYQGSDKYVTMKNVKGTWLAKQIADQETHITWSGTGVAGGRIPDWLAISQLQSSTFKTFKNLRKTITATKYQDKPLAYQIYMQKSQFSGEER